MEEQVTDISQALKRLTSEMHSMHEAIDALHTENANLRRNVERLQKENRSLRKRLEKYEKSDKNSNNSSTPPSKEKMKAEVIRRTKSLRKKNGLKPGGQPGHEARNRNMTEKPTVVKDCMSGYCRECGRD